MSNTNAVQYPPISRLEYFDLQQNNQNREELKFDEISQRSHHRDDVGPTTFPGAGKADSPSCNIGWMISIQLQGHFTSKSARVTPSGVYTTVGPFIPATHDVLFVWLSKKIMS